MCIVVIVCTVVILSVFVGLCVCVVVLSLVAGVLATGQCPEGYNK
jgi:hypothetical protein